MRMLELNVSTLALATAAALVVAPLAAQADLVTAGTHRGAFSFATSAAFVPISGLGTSLRFNLPTAKAVIITFSAECAVNAPRGNTTAWVDIDVRVDGIALPPTDTDKDAF